MKIGKNVGLLFCVRARAVLALINRQHIFNMYKDEGPQ